MFAHKCIMISLILNANYPQKQLGNLLGVCTWQPGFPVHQAAKKRTQQYQQLPGRHSNLGYLLSGPGSSRRPREFEGQYATAPNGKEIAPYLSHQSASQINIRSCIYKLHHHGRWFVKWSEDKRENLIFFSLKMLFIVKFKS